MSAGCRHRRAKSPENPDFPWCARHRLNLDRRGSLCRLCRDDPRWRENLALRHAARCRAAPPAAADITTGRTDAAGADNDSTTGGQSFYCPRYDTVADAALCRRCRDDPALKAFLHGQAAVRRAAAGRPADHANARRRDDCAERGELLRTEEIVCCGGQRRPLPIHRCRIHGEAHEARCRLCAEFRI